MCILLPFFLSLNAVHLENYPVLLQNYRYYYSSFHSLTYICINKFVLLLLLLLDCLVGLSLFQSCVCTIALSGGDSLTNSKEISSSLCISLSQFFSSCSSFLSFIFEIVNIRLAFVLFYSFVLRLLHGLFPIHNKTHTYFICRVQNWPNRMKMFFSIVRSSFFFLTLFGARTYTLGKFVFGQQSKHQVRPYVLSSVTKTKHTRENEEQQNFKFENFTRCTQNVQ